LPPAQRARGNGSGGDSAAGGDGNPSNLAVRAARRPGRPAISIGYAKKNDALLARGGVGAFCQPIEELDLSRLIADFQSLVDARGPFSDQVRRAVEQLRGHLQDQDAYILDKLL
jgi:hypothetical protein